MRGFQLWVNLPARAQDDAAALPGIRRRRDPEGRARAGRARISVIAGRFGDRRDRSPASRSIRSMPISRFRPTRASPGRAGGPHRLSPMCSRARPRRRRRGAARHARGARRRGNRAFHRGGETGCGGHAHRGRADRRADRSSWAFRDEQPRGNPAGARGLLYGAAVGRSGGARIKPAASSGSARAAAPDNRARAGAPPPGRVQSARSRRGARAHQAGCRDLRR